MLSQVVGLSALAELVTLRLPYVCTTAHVAEWRSLLGLRQKSQLTGVREKRQD